MGQLWFQAGPRQSVHIVRPWSSVLADQRCGHVPGHMCARNWQFSDDLRVNYGARCLFSRSWSKLERSRNSFDAGVLPLWAGIVQRGADGGRAGWSPLVRDRLGYLPLTGWRHHLGPGFGCPSRQSRNISDPVPGWLPLDLQHPRTGDATQPAVNGGRDLVPNRACHLLYRTGRRRRRGYWHR